MYMQSRPRLDETFDVCDKRQKSMTFLGRLRGTPDFKIKAFQFGKVRALRGNRTLSYMTARPVI